MSTHLEGNDHMKIMKNIFKALDQGRIYSITSLIGHMHYN